MSLHYLINTLSLILAVTSQQAPAYYYQSWLYAMPWQPLVVASSPTNAAPSTPPQTAASQHLDTQHLSLGYTGPQIFPPGIAATPPSGVQRPILLGLLRHQPMHGEFSLPFRPSPFAGYSLDKQEQPQEQPQEQHQEQQQQQEQQHQLEPGFYAPGYPQQTSNTNPVEEASDEQQIGEDQQQQHFIYMSPGTLYNLVSSAQG